ncbi:unnamed protein product [Miscanthus lutarioriparius]|uniref:Ammonium transporter AmtB-like domain-containing protein n=1 Tax=Miscanthus lutarioriparius TaxID=422564 RepID=A0A811PGD6_9POAL|nr:unnamed protein product [Miscanthus lutarioriparius]
MVLYAFTAVWICWVTWAYNMLFTDKLLPLWGKARPSLNQGYLVGQADLPATAHYFADGTTVETATVEPLYPMATVVYFQCVFVAMTLILVAGLLWGVIDYCGGYVIHLSAEFAGFTAAYWVGPRAHKDRERLPPNNILFTLTSTGLLWMRWAGFNGDGPYAANIVASMSVLNTNICTAMSLIVWTCLDVVVFKKPSIVGAVEGMITGLIYIMPTIVLRACPGLGPPPVGPRPSHPVHLAGPALGVAGLLGGQHTGLLADPTLCALFLPVSNSRGAFYGGGTQLGKQLAGALFIIGWNVAVTSIICVAINAVVLLRMTEDKLEVGDDAVHGEEVYALWGDGELYDVREHGPRGAPAVAPVCTTPN